MTAGLFLHSVNQAAAHGRIGLMKAETGDTILTRFSTKNKRLGFPMNRSNQSTMTSKPTGIRMSSRVIGSVCVCIFLNFFAGCAQEKEPASVEPTPRPGNIAFTIGEEPGTSEFKISLVEAIVGNPEIIDGNAVRVAKDRALMIRFEIKNIRDDNVLNFQGNNSSFKLMEGNDVIDRVFLSPGEEVKGALNSSSVIQPNSTATHIEVFEIPSTEIGWVRVLIDFECLGDKGVIEFLMGKGFIKNWDEY